MQVGKGAGNAGAVNIWEMVALRVVTVSAVVAGLCAELLYSFAL